MKRRSTIWRLSGALLAAIVAVAGADTVKLKDGTELQGRIVAETETEVTVEVSFANGTITQTRTHLKSEVAEISRLTPEQKALEETRRYELKLDAAFPQPYYDEVITNVFRKFLAEYPNSPGAAEVTAKIAAWETERDQVAAGKVKYRGQWLTEAERGRPWLDEARELMTRGNHHAAIERLNQVAVLTNAPALVAEARPLLATAHRQWLEQLQWQQQRLQSEIGTVTELVQKARVAAGAAEQAQRDAQGKLKLDGPRPVEGGERAQRTPGETGRMPRYLGNQQQPVERMGESTKGASDALAQAARARGELASAESKLSQLTAQRDLVEKQISVVRAASPLPDAAALAPAPVGTPAAESSRGLIDRLKDNALFVAIGLAVLLWLVAKFVRS